MDSAPWLPLLLTAFVTALLSSALTLGVAWWLFQNRWRPRVEAELETRFRERLDEAKEALGEVIRERVRQGVLEAVAELSSPEGLRQTAGGLAKAGSDLVARGLGSLLGGKG